MAPSAFAQALPGPDPQPNEALDTFRKEVKAEMDGYRSEVERLRGELAAERKAREEALQRQQEDTEKKLGKIKVGPVGLSFAGFVHADAVLYRQASQDEVNPSSGNPFNETRFLIKRARIRAQLDYAWLFGRLEFDGNTVNGPAARLQAAEVGVRYRAKEKGAPPYIAATIGLFKIPWGWEVMEEGDTQRHFLERSNVIRAMFPGEYDLGFKVHGGWRWFRYNIAAMNGNPMGASQFAARDPNQSKDIVGRLGIDAKVAGPFSFGAGFSGVWGTGFSRGAVATKDSLVWKDANMNRMVDPGEVVGVAGTAMTPAQNFQRWAAGYDVQLHFKLPRLGELMLYSELVYGHNMDRAMVVADPIVVGRELPELGYYVGFSMELTHYAMIGLRYDAYNYDLDSTEDHDTTYRTIAVAGSIRLPGYGRMILEYDHSTLGHAPDGLPTVFADKTVTVRGQLDF